jgi:hypothetical protein
MSEKKLRRTSNSSVDLRAHMNDNYVIVQDVSSMVSFNKYFQYARGMFDSAVRLYNKKEYQRAYVDFTKFLKFVDEKLPGHKDYIGENSESAKGWLDQARESASQFIEETSFQLDVIQDMRNNPDSRSSLIVEMQQHAPDIYIPAWMDPDSDDDDDHVPPAAGSMRGPGQLQSHIMDHHWQNSPDNHYSGNRAGQHVPFQSPAVQHFHHDQHVGQHHTREGYYDQNLSGWTQQLHASYVAASHSHTSPFIDHMRTHGLHVRQQLQQDAPHYAAHHVNQLSQQVSTQYQQQSTTGYSATVQSTAYGSSTVRYSSRHSQTQAVSVLPGVSFEDASILNHYREYAK